MNPSNLNSRPAAIYEQSFIDNRSMREETKIGELFKSVANYSCPEGSMMKMTEYESLFALEHSNKILILDVHSMEAQF